MKNSVIDPLPGPTRVRLEQTLAQWRHWRCEPGPGSRPEPVKLLGGGISNVSVLVAARERYVVRIDGMDPESNGLHRQLEWRALQAASSAQLAPTPRYFNPELGSLVCDYLPPDPVQTQSPGEIGKLLRSIHSLPPLHHRLDLRDRIMRLEKSIEHRGDTLPILLGDLRDRVLSLIDRLRREDRSVTLCHNDLLAANRLRSGGVLWALDWEYCAMGSPWHDLAVTASGDSMNGDETADLLRAYLGRPARPAESTRLAEYGRVYRYLELLWYLALQKTGGQGLLEQRAAELAHAWDTH